MKYSKPRALWGKDISALSLGCPGLTFKFLGTIRMTAQWSEASKVSEKQGLLSQMLRDLLGDIKTGSDRTGEDEFDDKHPPGMLHTKTGVY